MSSTEEPDIFGIDQHMPIDFVFLLLRLINYPGEPLPAVPGVSLTKLRFIRLKKDELVRFLIALERDTEIEIIPNNTGFDIKEILMPTVSVKAIWRAIDSYLKKFTSNDLTPINENYYSFKKQRQYFLELIQKKQADGASKHFLITDDEIEKGYRLFETLLILERQKYLTIENILNCLDPTDTSHYKIVLSPDMAKVRVRQAKEILNEPVNCIKTAPYVTWAHVFLKLSETFDITIGIDDEKYQTTCEKMGFLDQRSPNVTRMKKSWGLLQQIAILEGTVPTRKLSAKEKEGVIKRKQELTKILKKFFPLIPGNPFEPHDEKNGHRIKIHVEPATKYKETQYQDRRIQDPSLKKDSPFDDISDYLKEQSPEL